MQYLFDENAKRFLDASAGIVTVPCGHCHHDVVTAVVEQTKLLQHPTTIYLHHAVTEFAEALAEKMPGNLKVTLFSFICIFFLGCRVVSILHVDVNCFERKLVTFS